MNLGEKLDDAVRQVAKANNLTGHGQNSFRQMSHAVFEQIQPKIDQAVDQQVIDKVSAERTRIAEILDAPEAVGREPTARRLALGSDMPPKSVIEILQSTPKAQRGPTPLAVAMAGEDNSVRDDDGSDVGSGGDYETERLANSILNAAE